MIFARRSLPLIEMNPFRSFWLWKQGAESSRLAAMGHCTGNSPTQPIHHRWEHTMKRAMTRVAVVRKRHAILNGFRYDMALWQREDECQVRGLKPANRDCL